MLEPTPTAVLFPGQGSQQPAMRELVAAVRPDLIEQVTPLVGEDPFEKVDESTRFAQPAIFCALLAGWDQVRAFHSPQMQDAVIPFREALAEVDFHEPSIPVISCATTLPFVDPREELAAALVRPVRWRETMTALASGGVRTFVDAGPGRVLAKLAPRCVPGAGAASLDMLIGDRHAAA